MKYPGYRKTEQKSFKTLATHTRIHSQDILISLQIFLYGRQHQREVRQREAEKVLAGAHTDIWLERVDLGFWVRNFYCALARCLGKETKMSFPCYMTYSALFYKG